MQHHIPCPNVGHRALQHSLKTIAIGDTQTREQVTKFVRPASCLTDELGATYEPGELQRKDLSSIPTLFAYPSFIATTFTQHRALFEHSECRIYQFQTTPRSGPVFIFGLFITDGQHNLIDFCVDTPWHKRKPVLEPLMRAICTPGSVNRRLFNQGVH